MLLPMPIARQRVRDGSLPLALAILLLAGCSLRDSDWFHMRTPIIANEASVDEIVQVLNVNTLGTQTQQGLKSWHATNATVCVSGMVNVPATVAVEAPRNLRIRIAHPLSHNEVFDIGSNEEEFWVWAKDSEPAGVVHVRHDEVEVISQYYDLPLHPDWMMEVFGVVPLNPDDYRREESDEGSRYVDLVGHKTAPNGMLVGNVIRVDLRRGVIVQRSLHDEEGTVLGVARYSDHERDPHSQLMLPRQVELEVPAMDTSVTFYLNDVLLNPPAMQARVWTPPRIAGEPDIQLVETLPPEARRSTPSDPFGGEPGVVSLPGHRPESPGRAELDPTARAGNNLQANGWGHTEPPDPSDFGPGSESDPYSRWDNIGSPDPDVRPSATIDPIGIEMDFGEDAPLWDANGDFEPDPPAFLDADESSSRLGTRNVQPGPRIDFVSE
jgi:hypothetical protein